MLVFQPLSGWPTHVIKNLWRLVHTVIEDPLVRGFVLGSANDLGKQYHAVHQRSEDPPSWILPLYRSTNLHHTLDAESSLKQAFRYHPKCKDQETESRLSPWAAQFVYLLVWTEEAQKERVEQTE